MATEAFDGEWTDEDRLVPRAGRHLSADAVVLLQNDVATWTAPSRSTLVIQPHIGTGCPSLGHTGLANRG